MADGPAEGDEADRSEHRAGQRPGSSLSETLGRTLKKLSFRTPVHKLRLRGRYPLQLLDVPADPIPGSARAGKTLLDGKMSAAGETIPFEALDRGGFSPSPNIGRASPGCAIWRRRSSGAARRRSPSG